MHTGTRRPNPLCLPSTRPAVPPPGYIQGRTPNTKSSNAVIHLGESDAFVDRRFVESRWKDGQDSIAELAGRSVPRCGGLTSALISSGVLLLVRATVLTISVK